MADEGKARADLATRFQPGNPGKPRGARNRATRALEALVDGEVDEIGRTLVEKAKSGDMAALRLCLNRVAPASKDAPLDLDLPALETLQDVALASARLIAALAAGEVTPSEASRVMALLTDHLDILERAEEEEEEEEPEAEETVAEDLLPRRRPPVVFLD